MSDEEDLGDDWDTCYIPRRFWILFIVLGTFLYGIYNVWYFALASYMAMFNGSGKTDCYGPGCDATFTCAGTLETSYHFRWCLLGLGSLVFSILALDSLYNKYAVEMFQFSGFLFFSAVVHMITCAMDFSYIYLCNDHYSYNVIIEMVLWPLGGLPFGYAVQHEVRQLDRYPIRYIDKLCFHQVQIYYLVWTGIKILFCCYATYEAFILGLRFHYGEAGMGATFRISGWSERLKMKYEMRDVAYNTFGMAMATGMDLGWTEDEYKLQRPLRPPTWFRPGVPGGMMPGVSMPVSAATAYDGFQDNRRNVLL